MLSVVQIAITFVDGIENVSNKGANKICKFLALSVGNLKGLDSDSNFESKFGDRMQDLQLFGKMCRPLQ